MTCIVGVKRGSTVAVGADSLGSTAHYCMERAEPKVFRKRGFVMAYTTSFRMGNILQHVFKPPKYKGGDAHKFMVKKFIPSLRKCLKEEGYMKIINAEENAGTFIVAFRHFLFIVESDLQVGQPADDYIAHGSGIEVAMGSLDTSSKINKQISAVEMCSLALEAACKHVPTVGGTIKVLKV